MNRQAINFNISVTSRGQQALINTFRLLPSDTSVIGYKLITNDLMFLYTNASKDIVLFPAPLNRIHAARMVYRWLTHKYQDWIPDSSDGIYEEREYGWHFSTRGLGNLNGQTVGPECLGQIYPTVMRYSSSAE